VSRSSLHPKTCGKLPHNTKHTRPSLHAKPTKMPPPHEVAEAMIYQILSRSAGKQIFHRFALFLELGDGGVDLTLAEFINRDTLHDFP
jgi:hypothetical protein